MRALTIRPGAADTARIDELPEPVPVRGELLVEAVAVGVCGTDREIVSGAYGQAPPERDRLVLGHESLGRVLEPVGTAGHGAGGGGEGFAAGDLVVGVVRRPDPVPCGACAAGEFDMCRNGRFTERGINGLDGYARDRWTVESAYAVRLDPRLEAVGVLVEPTSVVAKAWEQVQRIGARSWFEPRRVLVTGAGPIGLLAALLGVQRGLDVHLLDRVNGGPKRLAAETLGATYHADPPAEVAAKLDPDVIIEATGAGRVVMDAINGTAAYGIVCLTGVSAAGREIRIDAGATNRELVLENDVVVGSVNANLRHYAAAADALAAADPDWLGRLITRRVPIGRFAEAFTPTDDDIKVVLTFDT